MACEICNKANRIFKGDQLICPNCENLKLQSKTRIERVLKSELKKAIHDFKLLSKNCNLNKAINVIAETREAAARTLIDDPGNSEAASIWILCLYVLANLPKSVNGDGSVGHKELMFVGKQIVEILSRSTLFKQNKIVRLESGEWCYTELQPLFRTSKEVDGKTFNELGFKPNSTEARALEQMMKAGMTEHMSAVESETINRNLRFYYPKYLLPYTQTQKMETYEKVALQTSVFIAGALGPEFSSNNGIHLLDSSKYDAYRESMLKVFGNEALDLLTERGPALEGENLGFHLFIFDIEQNKVFLPYYSLILISMIGYRWTHKSPGYAKRLGEEPENWIYNILTGYLNTTSPIDGKKLIRFKLGKKKPEIDVIGYNDQKIVLIESKFWESSNISELEVELNKFEKRVDYFNQNRSKYGFSNEQEVIPLFYFPWPPFPKYGNSEVTLVPSLSAIMWYMLTKFPPRCRPFAVPTKEMEDFLEKDIEERLFMSDLSDYLEVLPDMYRIQDVQVDEIKENEITVFSYISLGFATPFIFDLDEECRLKLTKRGVKQGTLLRALTFNLRGYWGDIQLATFKVLTLDSPFDPDQILADRNSMDYDKFLAHTFGPVLSKDLNTMIKLRKISLQRYMKWAQDTGHNVFLAVGSLLERNDFPNVILSQCDCGEVVALEKNLHSEYVKRHGNSVKCKNCDPDMKRKLEEIVGPMAQIDNRNFYFN